MLGLKGLHVILIFFRVYPIARSARATQGNRLAICTIVIMTFPCARCMLAQLAGLLLGIIEDPGWHHARGLEEKPTSPVSMRCMYGVVPRCPTMLAKYSVEF